MFTPENERARSESDLRVSVRLPPWPSIAARAIDGSHAGRQKNARRPPSFCAAGDESGAFVAASRPRSRCCCACCASVPGCLHFACDSKEPTQVSSASGSGAPGTRPEGVRDEREAAAHVREMFGRIAPRYDLLNHLLSLDIDKIWRRRVARQFRIDPAQPASARSRPVLRNGRPGTGVSQEAPHGAEIVGSDFVPEMLVRARAKAEALRAQHHVRGGGRAGIAVRRR